MRKTLLSLVIMSVVAPLAFTACDRTVSETDKTTKDSNGNVTKETVKKTTDDNGNVNVTHEKETITNNR